MHRLEEYVTVGTRRLRCGYTTGTCAAAAARAAMELLAAGREVLEVTVATPSGLDVAVEVERADAGCGWAACAVRKDAGDDPDVTDGLLVVARVEWADGPGVRVEGGEGVGRVTRAGLDQPVGAAAINSVPRRMIADQVEETLADAGCHAGGPGGRGVLVTISIPGGAEVAERTFNPRLGVVGGLSVIGTSGIVRPMSEDAMVESVRLELRQRRAEGADSLVVVPGNYGADFVRDDLGLDERPVMCSNYVGAALDEAVRLGFSRLLMVGHVGKMAKVAGGAMNTHSRVADGRMETLAALGAAAGAPRECTAAVLDAATTDAALDALDGAGVLEPAMDALAERLARRLNERTGGAPQVAVVVFSKARGLLCRAGLSEAEGR